MINKTTIFDAATGEITKFAKDKAGLTFEEGAGRDYIISEIFSAMDWDAYRPEEQATHVVVHLPLTKDDKNPYTGGLNGNMFTIKRGEDVEIPVGYYNTMVDSAERRFRIENVGKLGETQEGGPASRRVPLGGLEMRIVKFLNKGAKPPPPKKRAHKAEVVAEPED